MPKEKKIKKICRPSAMKRLSWIRKKKKKKRKKKNPQQHQKKKRTNQNTGLEAEGAPKGELRTNPDQKGGTDEGGEGISKN